jgi:predicted ABC-type exoprotein transport system permease subunit
MAEKEYLTERIKYLGDLLKLSCVFLIAIGGGTASLLLGELSKGRTVLAAFGIVIIIALVAFALILDRQIRTLIKELRKT